jgi:hypothetical protein
MPAPQVVQEPCRGEHRWEDTDNEDQINEINVIFGDNLSITSEAQGKKLERKINLVQRIEPNRRMKWSEVDISFRPEDHPTTELSNQNFPFMVKLPIGQHKVAKILIDNRASLNLIMRKTFIELGLNLVELTPVHDTFHDVISGQSSTHIGRIDLEVSCGSGDNKRKEMLTFEVASFNIRYNCILRTPFLLKFMAVIHTTYATIKMPDPKGVITIKAEQRDALACESTSLSYADRFSGKVAQEQAAKVVKMKGDSTPSKILASKPPIDNSPQIPRALKDTTIASASTPAPIDQKVDNKLKGTLGAEDKEVVVDPSNLDKKLRISDNLNLK